jgi:hypothetical protein
MNETPTNQRDSNLGPRRLLFWYIIGTAILSVAAFLSLLAFAEFAEQTPPGDTNVRQFGTRDVVLPASLMLVAGAIGGCASNMRRIIKFADPNKFDPDQKLSYYVRTFNGAIAGFFTFFLLISGALTFFNNQVTSSLAWNEPVVLAPFVTVALLAGFASREFGHKVHELAVILFLTEKEAEERAAATVRAAKEAEEKAAQRTQNQNKAK